MSKLLRRAFVNRENAESNYQKIALDDAYLGSCCKRKAVFAELFYMVK